MLFKNKLNKSAFTLIEMLLVMAMIAIIASTVIVATSGQKRRAQETRALAELSGIMQYILMCKSDGGSVMNPNGSNGGNNICNLGGSYGKWPNTGSGSKLDTFGSYIANFDNSSWYYSIHNGSSKICCNNISSRCTLLPNSSNCNETTILE